MKALINIREITHKEFCDLKAGDTIYIKCGGDIFQSEVIRPPFYNADADESDWEIETTNGFCDEYSLFVEEENNMENNNWIPISSGLYPQDMEDVQVTFIGYIDHAPHCEAFAYRNEGEWYWSLDDGDVMVEITAWKHNCEPYIEK